MEKPSRRDPTARVLIEIEDKFQIEESLGSDGVGEQLTMRLSDIAIKTKELTRTTDLSEVKSRRVS